MAVQEIKISDTESIWVEVEEEEIKALPKKKSISTHDLPDGAETIGITEDIVDAIALMKNNISSMAKTVYESLKDNQPEEWGIEMNIGFKGKANIIPVILSGETNGGIKVTAKWKKT